MTPEGDGPPRGTSGRASVLRPLNGLSWLARVPFQPGSSLTQRAIDRRHLGGAVGPGRLRPDIIPWPHVRRRLSQLLGAGALYSAGLAPAAHSGRPDSAGRSASPRSRLPWYSMPWSLPEVRSEALVGDARPLRAWGLRKGCAPAGEGPGLVPQCGRSRQVEPQLPLGIGDPVRFWHGGLRPRIRESSPVSANMPGVRHEDLFLQKG